MEYNSGTDQDTNIPPPHYNTDIAMQTYILQQGQNIYKQHGILQASAAMHIFKTIISVLIEILMYLLFLAAILLIVFIPTDPIAVSTEINPDAMAAFTLHQDEITGLMIILKLIIFIISLPILFCAILLRRSRKKSKLIRKAFTETDKMKKEFEQAIQYFRFDTTRH